MCRLRKGVGVRVGEKVGINVAVGVRVGATVGVNGRVSTGVSVIVGVFVFHPPGGMDRVDVLVGRGGGK